MLVGAPYENVANVDDEHKALNAEINLKRGLPYFVNDGIERDGTIVIVGGGPSLEDTIGEVRARKLNGCQIWAVNNTYKYLVDHQIQPDAHIFLDARPDNAEFIYPHDKVTYYLHKSCDPILFDNLDGKKIIVYGSNEATGFTVGIKAMYIAAMSGYRKIYMYGMDSSYRDESHHAYKQSLNDSENTVEITAHGKKYKCAPWMAIQADEFIQVAESMAEQGLEIYVAGDGLLPDLARNMRTQPKVLTCVWDMAICPHYYDYVVFLNECERHRKKIEAEFIDVVIQPGPFQGFRDAENPDNPGSREGMLYRVIMGMTRLLPSVRNLEVLKARRHITEEHVFPDGYTVNSPNRHYGQDYHKYAEPILEASVSAKRHIAKAIHGKYVTITLRESTHWPTRNSNKSAWLDVARFLEKMGYVVIWVPDAESFGANLYSFDIDMRTALYEGAVLNLGINNGPTLSMPFMNAKYMLFKMVTEDIPWTTREFHERWGTVEGPQPNGRGWLIFEPDDYEIIIRELQKFFNTQPLEEINARI